MDTYYFAYLSLTSTQLYILAMDVAASTILSRVDTFLDLQRISSEASPVILVNRSWALHFFDKGFNIDFVSSLFSLFRMRMYQY